MPNVPRVQAASTSRWPWIRRVTKGQPWPGPESSTAPGGEVPRTPAPTDALGRAVTFTDVPAEAFAGSLRGALPPWQVAGLLEDYAHYRRGEAAAVSPAVAEITGRAPADVRQFARDYAPAFSR